MSMVKPTRRCFLNLIANMLNIVRHFFLINVVSRSEIDNNKKIIYFNSMLLVRRLVAY